MRERVLGAALNALHELNFALLFPVSFFLRFLLTS